MAKRKRATTSQQSSSNDEAPTVAEKKSKQEKNGGLSMDRELERKIAAIKAVSEMEVEILLTGLRLIRSYFVQEQLQTPFLLFLKENFLNVDVVRNGEDEHFDLRWKDDYGNLSAYNTDGREIDASLVQHMGMAYPLSSDARQSVGGYQFSAKNVKNAVSVDDLQIGTYLSQESLNTVMLAMPECLQTPGAQSLRLSMGITPKSRRLPKHGEMLLSVHGSPLGIYKEDNMKAIHESAEG